ncbi:hypothetical protein COOONC_11899 [Cooperia oncophora]
MHDKFEDAIRNAENQLKVAELENNELLQADSWFNLGSLYHTRARGMLQKISTTCFPSATESDLCGWPSKRPT